MVCLCICVLGRHKHQPLNLAYLLFEPARRARETRERGKAASTQILVSVSCMWKTFQLGQHVSSQSACPAFWYQQKLESALMLVYSAWVGVSAFFASLILLWLYLFVACLAVQTADTFRIDSKGGFLALHLRYLRSWDLLAAAAVLRSVSFTLSLIFGPFII